MDMLKTCFSVFTALWFLESLTCTLFLCNKRQFILKGITYAYQISFFLKKNAWVRRGMERVTLPVYNM